MTLVKEYKKPDELINILATRGMIFSQPNVAKKTLNEINYFFLKGYQKLLVDSKNEKKYKPNCDFCELTNLYFFDKELKALLLEYLLDIEQKIKTAMSNVISSNYGVRDRNYLLSKNFDKNSPYLKTTLTTIRNQKKSYGEKNTAVKYYKDVYGYIPFYVLSKCLTIGAIKKLYNVMKQSDQSEVCNQILFRVIINKRISRTKQLIAMIADVRNMCAHDEIVFNFVHRSIDIGEFPEHKQFQLKRTKYGNLIQGRKDLFALLLCMKYLMNRTDYNRMIQSLEGLINKTASKSKVFSKEELIEYMNLPLDYYVIKQIK